MSDELEKIANGGDFDIVYAVRHMAKEINAIKNATDGAVELDAGQRSLHELFEQRLADVLMRAGYGSVEALRGATDAELQAVEGIGPKTLEQIRAVIEG